jgi:hypothetical protein
MAFGSKSRVTDADILRCAFCGKGSDEGCKMVSSGLTHICGECIDRCASAMGVTTVTFYDSTLINGRLFDPGEYQLRRIGPADSDPTF